ncbi:MAG: RHS repeat-associated core domain-containing protein [Litorimonas sp.]
MSAPTQAPVLTLSYGTEFTGVATVFHFDGATRVQHAFSGSGADAFPVLPLTLSFWAKTDDLGTSTIVEYVGTRSGSPGLSIKQPSNLVVSLGGSSWITGVSVADNQWHHVVIVLTPGRWGLVDATLEIDSCVLASSSGAFTLSVDNGVDPVGELTLGGTSAAAQLTAEISEFRLWSDARTADQRLTDLQRRVIAPQIDLILVWALSDNATTGTVVGGGAGSFVASTLRFRESKSDQSDFAMARWTELADATGYDLQVASETGWVDIVSNTLQHTAPLSGLLLGSSFQGRSRGRNADGAGPWSSVVALTPIDLPQTATGLDWRSNNTELWAEWPGAAQAVSYRVGLKRTPAQSAPADPVVTTDTSANVSTILADPNGWQVFVEGLVSGSSGPSNLAGPVSAPAVSLYFVNQGANGTFEFDWPSSIADPASALFKVDRDTTSLVDAVKPSPTSPQGFESAQPVSAGESVSGETRFVYPAALTATQTQNITIDDIPAPEPVFQIAPTVATESVAWTWGSITQTPEFDVALQRDGVTIEDFQKTDQQSLSLNDYLPTTAADLHAYTIVVQGIQGGTVGPPNTITPGEVTTGLLAYRWPGGTDPGALSLEWLPGSAANQQIYARVFEQGQQEIYYHGIADITAKNLAVPAPDAGLNEGDVYSATVSVMAAGSFTGAFASSATLHKITAPVVTLLADSQAMTLFANWTAPVGAPVGTSYAIRLNATDDGSPQAGLTYNLTSHLQDADMLTMQVEATFENSYSAASMAGQAPAANPSLAYQAAPGGGGTLTASWTASAITYFSLASSADPTVTTLYTDGTDQRTVANPATGTTLTLSVKSIEENQLGAMESPAAVVIHDLAAPILSFEQATGSDLTASWTVVDAGGPAVTYQTQLDGVDDGAPLSATSTLLVGILDRNPTQSEAVDVQAIAEGSHGLWSPVASIVATTSVTVLYDPASHTATISWPASTDAKHYATRIVDAQATTLGRGWRDAPASNPPANYSQDIVIAALADREVITASVRALTGGMITAETTAELTMRTFPAPGLASSGVQDNASADTLDVSWTFNPATYGLSAANTVYDVEVKDDGGTVVGAANGVSGTSTTVSYPASTTDGSTLHVQVRAIGDGVIGAWSSEVSVVVGSALGQPLITDFSFDAQNAMTINWMAVPSPASGDTVTYSINVTGPGLNSIFPKVTTETSITLSASETGVTEHTTYTAIVTATLPAPPGPASPSRTATTNTLQPSNPGGGNGDHGGDPFNLANGAYIYSHADLVVEAISSLRMTVHYNSMLGWADDHPAFADQPLGSRWNHTFSTRLYIPETQPAEPYVMLIWGHWELVSYDLPSAVGPLVQRDRPTGDILDLNADGSYTLTRLDQSRYLFDAAGRLTRIEDAYGNPAVLTYNAVGRLDRVTDQASGRYIQFNYAEPSSATSLLDSIADNAGRRVAYAFQSGLLSSSTGPGPGPRRFTYVGDALMKTAGDENQHGIIDNTYDPTTHRITNQKTPNAIAQGEDWAYAIGWADGTDPQGHDTLIATLTDPENQQSITTSLVTTADSIEKTIGLGGANVLRHSRAFDGAGRLLSDAEYEGASGASADAGANTTYGYDGRGRVTLINPPGLGQILMTYDEAGNLLTSTDLLGNVTTRTYHADNTLNTETQPDGTQVRYAYKPGAIKGLVVRIEVFPGAGNGSAANVANTLSQTFNSEGQLETRTDATGNVTRFDYASRTGWLTSHMVIDADGSTLLIETMERDPATGRVTSLKRRYDGQPEAQAFETTYQYDNVGNVKVLTAPGGSVWRYDYDAANNRIQTTYPQIDGRTDVETYVYDRNNQLTRVVLQGSNPRIARATSYDPAGRVQSHTDPKGNETVIAYEQVDRDGLAVRRATTTYPPAATSATPIFDFVETDPLGRRVAWALPTEQGNTPVTVTQSFATAPGQPDTTVGLKRTVTIPPSKSGGDSTAQVWVADFRGRPLSHTNQADKTWNWNYAPTQSVVGGPVNIAATLVDPEQLRRVDFSNPNGLPIAIKLGPDGASHDFGYQYDALARLRATIDPIPADPPQGGGTPGFATTLYDYAFDSTHDRTKLSVAAYGGDPADYFYDGEGRFVAYRDPNGVTGSYAYGRSDRMTSWTNGRGETFAYGFDPAGRFVSTTWPDGKRVEHTLDDNGNRLTTSIDGTVAITRSFDNLNRMLSRDIGGQTVGCSYTPSGREQRLTYPDGKTVTYGYDALDRLETVTDWASRQTIYTYLSTGQLHTETRHNDIVVTNSYDDAGRLLTMTAVAKGDEIVINTAFTYDDYATRHTLTQIAPAPPSETPVDANFTYVDDRLTQVDQDHVTYDDDGNLLGWGESGSGQIGYDALNRVVSLDDQTFAYDADGLRISAATGGDTQTFVQDIADYRSPRVEMASPLRALRTVEQTETTPNMLVPSSPASLARPAGLRSPLDRVLTATAGGDTTLYVHGVGLIGHEDAGGTYADYVFDPLGASLGLIGESGVPLGGRIYAPYGATLGAFGASPAPFGYAGRYGVMEDGEAWHYMRAREYGLNLSRFTARDVIYGDSFLAQTLNRYAYVSGQVLTLIDPTGLGGDHDGGGGGWGLFGAIAGGLAVGTIIGGSIIASLSAGGAGTVGTVIGGGAAAGGGIAGGAAAAGEIGTLAETEALLGESATELGEMGGELQTEYMNADSFFSRQASSGLRNRFDPSWNGFRTASFQGSEVGTSVEMTELSTINPGHLKWI